MLAHTAYVFSIIYVHTYHYYYYVTIFRHAYDGITCESQVVTKW